jgi:RNA polymerase II elongation factor ELL
MSLPGGVKLSVQGHSRPGDTLHSVPKQAMLVRMTAETLDALQATPTMEFAFGSEPVRRPVSLYLNLHPIL